MIKSVALVVAFSLVLLACGGDDEVADSTVPTETIPSTTTTTLAEETTTTTMAAVALNVWPLTGRERATVAPIQDVLIVKIDNTSNARPQVGLEKADMVIEVLVEGGVARMLAFFQSSMPAEVGPVRSAREVDPKLIAPFGALMAHSGGQGPVISAVRQVSGDVGHPSLGSEAYFRQSGRPGTYDLILRASDVLGSDSPDATDTEWLTFGEAPGKDDHVSLALSMTLAQSSAHTVNYRYSQSEGGYLRFLGEAPHLVLGPGETYANRNAAEEGANPQLVAANVIVVLVPVINTGRTDSAGSSVPDYDVVGSGVAVVFRDGVAIQGSWERSNTSEFFRFVDPDGHEIPLAQGTTWIQLTPLGRSLKWE